MRSPERAIARSCRAENERPCFAGLTLTRLTLLRFALLPSDGAPDRPVRAIFLGIAQRPLAQSLWSESRDLEYLQAPKIPIAALYRRDENRDIWRYAA